MTRGVQSDDLDLSQQELVERNWDGPVQVLGGAGTGKTLIAVHRACWLARNLRRGGDVLLTTFTSNLAEQMRDILDTICSPERVSRIEVTYLDSWLGKFLWRVDPDLRIVFDRKDPQWDKMWQRALLLKDTALPDTFYEDEFDHVVLANGIDTKDDYLHVSRKGRGIGLDPKQRARVWHVFDSYREQLKQHNAKEVDDAYRTAATLLRGGSSYAAVVVDEGQDLGPQALHLLRALVPERPNDLFIVGDHRQRIYNRSPMDLKCCGIEVPKDRTQTLRHSYRTTKEIIAWAAPLLRGREINPSEPEQMDLWSPINGPKPLLRVFESFEEQAAFIQAWLDDQSAKGHTLKNTCIVARSIQERNALRDALVHAGKPVLVLGKGRPPPGEEGVRVATMHRVKGLEFENVIAASVNDGFVPLRKAIEEAPDDIARERAETEERALLYVAATRARRWLLVLVSYPSNAVAKVERCSYIDSEAG